LRHAEASGIRIHQISKTLQRTADAFCDRHGNIVGRFDHQHLQRIVDGHGRADLEPHLGGLLRRRVTRYCEQRIDRDATFLYCAQGCVGRHQFGDGGRVPGKRGVLGVQYFPGRSFDQKLCVGPSAIGAGERQQAGKTEGKRSEGVVRKNNHRSRFRVLRSETGKFHI
jgi:hypothetical protein